MKLYVAMPIHGSPQAHTMVCVSHALVDLAKDHDLKFDPFLNASNLAETRCLQLHEAISEGFDKLLFVDSDMMFRPDQVRALLAEEGAVVAAAYRRKEPKVSHVGYPLEKVGNPGKRRGDLIGMACVGMGLTVLDLAWFREQRSIRGFNKPALGLRDVPAWFEFKVDEDLGGERRLLGEDEMLCKNVIIRGGDVWLHSKVLVGHVGAFVYE